MATISFEYACDKDTGFLQDPNVHKTFGYVTSLMGFGLPAPLASDLTVYTPWNQEAGAPKYTGLNVVAASEKKPMPSTKVVGVLEKWSWDGKAGGTLEVEAWMSQENALQVKYLQQLTLKNTKIQSFGWWIADYDQELKTWYEKCFPIDPTPNITGLINGQDGNMDLDADLVGAQAASGIDVLVYKVSFKVAPAANQQYTFMMANSATKPAVKSWGLVVGTLAAKAVAPV